MGQLRSCGACLQARAKRQALQWIDGPDKTGNDCVDSENLDVKLDED